MQITVIGTGYVGLVSGVCFSELGFHVTCVDRDQRKIAVLQAGEAPFYEPGLAEMMVKNVAAGRLKFVDDLSKAAAPDVIFIAVGTPPNEVGLPDMRALWSVVESIDAHVKDAAVIVIKSTMPPGTCRKVADKLPKHMAVSNPEFLREGSAIADFMAPDRIVVGVREPKARAVMQELYAPLDTEVFFTTPESSEMIKYVANDLLATRIAYINEMADICEKLGADVTDVAKGIGLDKRIGPHFLRPGPGFGGSCFPKDVLAMVEIAKCAGVPTRILEACFASNEARKKAMAGKIIDACGGDVKGKTLAVLGVTFKADTDDMRESPSLAILPALIQAGASIRAYDPEGMKVAAAMLPDSIHWCRDSDDAMQGADAAIILTEWHVFRTLELAKAASLLRDKLVIDLRNLYEPALMHQAGLRYVSVGRSENATPSSADQIEAA